MNSRLDGKSSRVPEFLVLAKALLLWGMTLTRRNTVNADFTKEDLAFQDEARSFLDSEFPVEYRAKIDASKRLSKEEIVQLAKDTIQKRMGQHRRGQLNMEVLAGRRFRSIFFETEMGLIGAPEPVPFGMKMVAPIIMTYGSDEQKARFLPDILEKQCLVVSGLF